MKFHIKSILGLFIVLGIIAVVAAYISPGLFVDPNSGRIIVSGKTQKLEWKQLDQYEIPYSCWEHDKIVLSPGSLSGDEIDFEQILFEIQFVDYFGRAIQQSRLEVDGKYLSNELLHSARLRYFGGKAGIGRSCILSVYDKKNNELNVDLFQQHSYFSNSRRTSLKFRWNGKRFVLVL